VLERSLGVGETLFPDDTALDAALTTPTPAWAGDGIGIHALVDDTYPARLRDIHQMPPIVFTRGTLGTDRRAVAVVGTRKPTQRGVAIAEAIVTVLAESGVTTGFGLGARGSTPPPTRLPCAPGAGPSP
jgi:DNA processing protein